MSSASNRTVQAREKEVQRLIDSASEGEVDGYAGKRGHTRFAEGVLLDVTTDPGSEASVWGVTMHNISESGFSFQSRVELSPGTEIFVREFTEDGSRLWVPARVRHRS